MSAKCNDPACDCREPGRYISHDPDINAFTLRREVRTTREVRLENSEREREVRATVLVVAASIAYLVVVIGIGYLMAELGGCL